MSAQSHAKPRYSKDHSALWAAFVIFLMLASSLAAMSTTAAAQDAEPTPPGEQLAPPTQGPADLPTQPVVEPPEDPTAVPTEDPILPPLQDPVLEQPDEPASIAVSYRVCPAGTDVDTLDPATLASICTGQQNGVAFDLRPVSGGIFVWQTGDAGPSAVFFSDVPAGQATLYGASQGAGIFCQGNTSQGNTKPYARIAAFTEQQFQGISLDVLQGEQITCDWYVVGTEAAEGDITVHIRTYACPVGYDASALDIFDLALNCHGGPGVINFSVFEAGGGYDGGVKPTSGGPGGGVFNSVQFDNVANVPLWINSEIPTGFGDPLAFCSVDDFLGNSVLPTRHYLWNAGKIELDPPGAENVVQCDWFFVPSGAGTVYLNKHACPAGYDASAHDMFDMAQNCHENAGVVNFNVVVYGAGGYEAGLKPTSGGAGGTINDVTFNNVPNVKLMIYEEIPAGYGEPVFFCKVEDQLGTDVKPFAYHPWEGDINTIPVEAPGEGNYVYCDVYNASSEGDNSVTVYKWDCIPGTQFGQALDYYQGDGQDEGPCETEHLNIPITLIDGNGSHPTTTQANGTQWDGIVLDQNGGFQIVEDIPDGYGDPMVFCGTLDEDEQQPVTATDGTITIQPTTSPFTYQCNWYNIPYEDSTVTIRKWECPEDSTIEPTWDAHQTACTQPMDGVEFTLTDTKGQRSMTTAGGQVQWTDVAPGAVTVTETVPPGYHPQPFVVCSWMEIPGLQVPFTLPQPVEATNGVLHVTIPTGGLTFVCDWYNTYAGAGEVTIYKWTCPEGYDPFAWNADPKNDCTQLTNGVTFVLDQPAGVDLQTNTGDSINGAVYFGGLEPGSYTVTEIVPDGISLVFVFDCVGLNTGAVHPMPLSVGPLLEMNIAGGDEIVCDWMNVPAYDPDFGWMTVYKYICWTPTYVSDIDCEVYEDGQSFDLEMLSGGNWTGAASGTTNAAGQLTWINLGAGTYRLAEPNGTPCRVESNMISNDGYLTVQQNAGTIVNVYNCSTTPPVPGGKMPTKYPNTGVEPVGSSDGVDGSFAPMAGLFGAAALSRRQLLRRAVAPSLAIGAGSLLFGTGIARQVIQPIGTPVGTPSGTPAADCLFPATPVATPEATPATNGTPVSCARGAVPVHLTIDDIDVDAEIEILETIGGEMQAPTGAEDVAWYKESARLGEIGNILVAGHLNYWGVPEGVFFRLEALAEGDAVEIEGDDDETYRYIVEWAENFPSDEEPPEEALGHTENQSLTLITCGGEWSADIAEYDHRTVVRAIRDIESA